jgi:hypothetical protein
MRHISHTFMFEPSARSQSTLKAATLRSPEIFIKNLLEPFSVAQKLPPLYQEREARLVRNKEKVDAERPTFCWRRRENENESSDTGDTKENVTSYVEPAA